MSTTDEAYMKNVVMPNVLKYFSATLAVTPVTGNLSVNPCTATWSGGINSGKCTSKQSYKCGSDTDFIAEAHYRKSDICTDNNSAGSCQSYGGNGVPDTDFIMYIYAELTGNV